MLYCANHPNTETLLRCNKCGKPICLKCAVLTDVGYRCPECIREVQNKYFNALTQDNPVALLVSLGVTTVATPILGVLLGVLGFFWGSLLALFIGSAAGGVLGQIIRKVVGRRRGRYLRYFALAGILLGVVIGSVISAAITGYFPLFSIPVLILTFLASATMVQLLR